MTPAFWIKRFFTVFLGIAALLFVVYLLRDYSPRHAAAASVLWGAISAAIFVIGRYFQARRGQHCAICRDTPETAGTASQPPGRVDRS